MELKAIREMADRLKANVAKVIVGKEEVVDLLLIALISSGHALLEDVPGTGKTLTAKTLAKSMNGQFRRIQFTPDLLPSDLTGIHFYNQKSGEFEFRPGPLFANIVLADEINRATPRTQSSLLECMEEKQLSIDGHTHILQRPFMVVATQNPVESQGTFPLPEAQMDRFLLKIHMGYPSFEEGIDIMNRFKAGSPIEQVEPVADASTVAEAQRHYSQVEISGDLTVYLLKLVERTRNHDDIALGVSPRGSQALLRAVQVKALLMGRNYVIPDDIKAMVQPVMGHRIMLNGRHRHPDQAVREILEEIVKTTEVPTEEQLV